MTRDKQLRKGKTSTSDRMGLTVGGSLISLTATTNVLAIDFPLVSVTRTVIEMLFCIS